MGISTVLLYLFLCISNEQQRFWSEFWMKFTRNPFCDEIARGILSNDAPLALVIRSSTRINSIGKFDIDIAFQFAIATNRDIFKSWRTTISMSSNHHWKSIYVSGSFERKIAQPNEWTERTIKNIMRCAAFSLTKICALFHSPPTSLMHNCAPTHSRVVNTIHQIYMLEHFCVAYAIGEWMTKQAKMDVGTKTDMNVITNESAVSVTQNSQMELRSKKSVYTLCVTGN